MQIQKQHGIGDSFRGLIAAVINRALADLEKNNRAMGASDHVRDEAMSWVNGPECEAFCYALDIDYRTIRGKATTLYQRLLEKAEGREKAHRKSGAGEGKPRSIVRNGPKPNRNGLNNIR
jgi:hypothetical protein